MYLTKGSKFSKNSFIIKPICLGMWLYIGFKTLGKYCDNSWIRKLVTITTNSSGLVGCIPYLCTLDFPIDLIIDISVISNMFKQRSSSWNLAYMLAGKTEPGDMIVDKRNCLVKGVFVDLLLISSVNIACRHYTIMSLCNVMFFIYPFNNKNMSETA